MGLVELQEVSKRFGSTEALSKVTLDIAAGRTTVLIGSSGCGKSTLLRTVMGLVVPDAGQVRFAGQVVRAQHSEGLRHRMGYVIQQGGLFAHLTAEANVGLLARHLGWSRTRRTQRIEALCELCQLDPQLLERYPPELSGGQQQRVGLMRALMLDPELLVLDEPLGALDPLIRADLQRELRNIFSQLQKTVLLVTHDLREAAFFAHHVALMREGRIVQQGTMDSLLHAPKDPFVTRFVQAQQLSPSSETPS